jgi:hypothetical protein
MHAIPMRVAGLMFNGVSLRRGGHLLLCDMSLLLQSTPNASDWVVLMWLLLPLFQVLYKRESTGYGILIPQ